MGFHGSSVAVEVWIGCSVGCCVFVTYVIIVDVDARVVVVISRLKMVMIVDGGVLKGVAYGCVVSFVVGVVGKM